MLDVLLENGGFMTIFRLFTNKTVEFVCQLSPLFSGGVKIVVRR